MLTLSLFYYFFYLPPHLQALMIGDDLVNDVGGAQSCGMKGVQVRTGKYRLVFIQVTGENHKPSCKHRKEI